MGRELVCDICRKPTTEIVGKLFYAPMTASVGAKSFHNNYQLHADVGVCCGSPNGHTASRIQRLFNWRKRMTAKQYHESRRRVKA